MEEFNFKRAELEDKEVISDYFRRYPSRSCERTFVNVFLWSRKYPVNGRLLTGHLYLKVRMKSICLLHFLQEKRKTLKKSFRY